MLLFVCGRGGIGIRARLRGVSGNGYGFKSRRPHFPAASAAGFYEKAIRNAHASGSLFVEMRGVEPLSENPSSGLSPSAFRDQFPRADVRGNTVSPGSFIITDPAAKLKLDSFPAIITPVA